ncbi:hypothetical protein NicSoilB8_46210 (plasmid) [Arthrobacter sp. NicSoilB8]|nr:hypothetical protein NicSoilB8_46210 [Arthrobacter sp. NicSoilB8]
MLTRFQSVNSRLSAVAQQQSLRGEQLSFQLSDGAEHALIVIGQEANLRQGQQGGVRLLTAVGLRERVEVPVESEQIYYAKLAPSSAEATVRRGPKPSETNSV